jgi:hypothetical protein
MGYLVEGLELFIRKVAYTKYCDMHAVGQQSTVETLVYNPC